MATNKPGDPDRKDPLPVFCFQVLLSINTGSKAEMFFKSVGGLKMETELVPVKEGGFNNSTWQLVGSRKWSNIVLKQGFTGSSKLIGWHQDWMNGAMTRLEKCEIVQLNTALKKVCSWSVLNGMPAKWEISEFDAGKSELAIETLEIAHEGLWFNG
jgi:phage tail-like protein